MWHPKFPTTQSHHHFPFTNSQTLNSSKSSDLYSVTKKVFLWLLSFDFFPQRSLSRVLSVSISKFLNSSYFPCKGFHTCPSSWMRNRKTKEKYNPTDGSWSHSGEGRRSSPDLNSEIENLFNTYTHQNSMWVIKYTGIGLPISRSPPNDTVCHKLWLLNYTLQTLNSNFPALF